jgi:GT2 family glycosyltransferase
VVVIGRNESPRLARALAAVEPLKATTVYVDSGSSDGSAEIAERAGVHVLRLVQGPFTAARGRREGFDFITARMPGIEHVQFIDGDCAIDEGWFDDGLKFLDEHPECGAVVGRLREEHAGRSLLIRVVEVEWDLPEGDTDVIGGISLMRASALRQVGNWRIDLVAGEELDLSSRLRAAGFGLHRLARDMCRHDIGITRLGEFWKRSVRTGHSYAQLAVVQRRNGPKRWMKRTLGHLAYGLVIPPAMAVAAVFWWPGVLLGAAVYLLLIARLAMWRLGRGDELDVALTYAAITAVCKIAAGIGALKYFAGRLTGKEATIFEYKGGGGSAGAGEPGEQGASA